MLFSWIRKVSLFERGSSLPLFQPGVLYWCVDFRLASKNKICVLCIPPVIRSLPNKETVDSKVRNGGEVRTALPVLALAPAFGGDSQVTELIFSSYWAVIGQFPDNILTCFWRHPRRFLSDGRICSTRIWTVASRGHSLLRQNVMSHCTYIT